MLEGDDTAEEVTAMQGMSRVRGPPPLPCLPMGQLCIIGVNA